MDYSGKEEDKRVVCAEREISLIMVTRQFYPLTGGTEKQAELLARILQRVGLTIKLITAKLNKKWKRKESIGELEVTRLPSPRIKVIGTILYSLSLIYYLIRHKKHYDIIHVHRADYDAVIAIPLGKLMGKKVLVKLACSGTFGDIECLKKSPIRFFALHMIKKADKIIAVNEDIKKELLAVGCKQHGIVMIPNGVDITLFKPKAGLLSSKNKVVTFVGRLHEQKGLEYLIRAWKHLIEKFERPASSFELHLNLIGEGPLEEKLVTIAAELNLTHTIHFLGLTKNVEDYLQHTDVFVNASLFEGISNALLEAMACGLPIVATDIGGNSELIKNEYNGLLVPPADPEALTSGMECLLTNVAKAKKLGTNARVTAEKRYASQVIADDYLVLYRNLLDYPERISPA